MDQEQAKPDSYDVILLGLHSDPGIRSHLRTYGFEYVAKALNSTHKNWGTINRLLSKHLPEKKLAVVTKITEYSLVLSLLPEYEEEFKKLCELIPQFRHVGYLYDGTMT